MRRRITKALVAAAAAGATITTMSLAAAGSASAAATVPAAGAAHRIFASSVGPPIYTPKCSGAVGFNDVSVVPKLDIGGCAGYVASGRDFRYAQALITIPTSLPTAALTNTTAPILDVGLSSSDAVASAGIMTCAVATHVFGSTCTAGTWVAIGLFAWNNGAGLVTSPAFPVIPASAGTGVLFSV